jgi:hypothetical protein
LQSKNDYAIEKNPQVMLENIEVLPLSKKVPQKPSRLTKNEDIQIANDIASDLLVSKTDMNAMRKPD